MTYSLDTIVARAKRRAFTFPWSDIYWWLANARDLWPYWALLRKNILDAWWKHFVQERQDMVGLDASILMNPKVWEASGHVSSFSDPLVDCRKCKYRDRADKLIEEHINKNWLTLEQVREKIDIDNMTPEAWTFDQQTRFLSEFKVKCPKCWSCDWTEPKKFNLMFKTQQWVIDWEWKDIYLRPETAQWIFVNFKNILDTTRMRVPFWVAQVWKSFRNEITPGNFLFRVREFEQMEIEFFCEADEEKWLSWLQKWKETCEEWRIQKIGINKEKLRFRQHDPKELAFYSKWTWDVEYLFPRWWWELQGIAYRTDYDLQQHMKFSGKDMQYTDPITWARYVPHCVEPSRWLTRAVLTAMIDAYDEEEYTNWNWEKETRTVAHFHKNIAPIKFAILPLVKKDEKQVEIAEKIFHNLSKDYFCEYDDNWAIGKRYRRQDEIWTPYCITVDQQSCEDWETVTIRDRDSMEQKRIKISEIANYMK